MQAEADASAGLGRFDRKATEPHLQARLKEWRDLLGREVASTRIIARLIPGKIVMTPTTTKSGEAVIDVQIPWTAWPLFAGIHW